MNIHSTPTNSGNPYIKSSPASPPITAANTLTSIGQMLESGTKKVESFAGNLFTHFRTGPGITTVAASRLDHAARFVIRGGSEHVFQKEFGHIPGENLKKSHACYLSITGGPILGTLFVSNIRVGFKSDGPVWTGPGCGPGQWVYYKIVIFVNQIEAVNSVTNHTNTIQKYIEIVTKDGHEFWFMGFILYDKALSNLNEALHNSNNKFVRVS
uniref:GRAM domain-containing protein n=1 Tax=Chenopodium quinoa TaxID=63459 RepID=A0A803LPG9_CHEQI